MSDHSVPPRVRFAPSPTGYLHVGGARTALFNWLLARRTGGTFVLRIEDTDMERSSDAMVQGILDGMRWLGLTWDEGPEVGGPHAPYFQSQRLDRYRTVAAQLVASGHAYYDYRGAEARTRSDASASDDTALPTFGPKQYDETSVTLSAEEVAAREAAGTPRAVRFRVPPEGRTTFVDAVHGEIGFDNSGLEDFVVLRSDGYPFSTDLWSSATWQAAWKRGGDAAYGRRTVNGYVQRDEFELYDLEQDPDESRNLTRDPAHSSTLATYKARLRAFQERTSDPWVLKWTYQ